MDKVTICNGDWHITVSVAGEIAIKQNALQRERFYYVSRVTDLMFNGDYIYIGQGDLVAGGWRDKSSPHRDL